MIVSFKDRETKKIFDMVAHNRIYSNVAQIVERRLRALHRATILSDLSNPPGNHLEVLKKIDQASTAYGSTINTGYASDGRNKMSMKSKSSTINNALGRRHSRERPPIHPGEMLREEFLVPMGLSANALAMAMGVPATRVSEIVNERRSITADTALRLGLYFHMSAEFWMGLQSDYDLEIIRYTNYKSIRASVRPAPLDPKTGALKTVAA